MPITIDPRRSPPESLQTLIHRALRELARMRAERVQVGATLRPEHDARQHEREEQGGG